MDYRKLIQIIFSGALYILVPLFLFPQKISLSPVFENNISLTNFSILGQQDSYYYVWANNFDKPPRLMVYNNNMEPVSSREIAVLKNSRLLAFLPHAGGADLLYENNDGENRYYKQTRINKEAELVSPEKTILSLPLQPASDWDFASSPSGNCFLVYHLTQPVKDSVKMDMIIIGKDYEVVDGKRFNFFVESDFERLGNLFMDDDANIYIMVHDRPLNYKLGSRLRLYKYYSSGGLLVKKEFYQKEKKPVDVRLSFRKEGKLVYLHSLYADFYTKDINGIFTAALNDKLDPVVPFTYFVFDKKFKKELNTYSSGVSSDNLMNYLRINQCSVSDSGSSFVSLTLETTQIIPPVYSGFGQPAAQRTTATEQDPILQREYLLRREMGIMGPIRGRRAPTGGSGSSTGYAEAYSNVMNQRPDLFFMNRDTTANNKEISLPRKKIYDRQLVFGFNKNGELQWHRWFETEDQNLMKNTPLLPAETGNSVLAVYYRKNKKEKTELAFTRISKPDGRVYDIPLQLPEHISLLTTSPLCRLSNNTAAILYLDNKQNKAGLAKLEW